MSSLNQNFWSGKTVVVTGGAGFLGSHLVARLKSRDPKQIIIPRSEKYDLRTERACREVVKGVDIVIHLAATVGGIGFNQAKPAELFYDNIMMGVQLMEQSRLAGVEKF